LNHFPPAELAREFAQAALDAEVREDDYLWIARTALLVQAIKKAGGNQSKAARILGIHRNLLARRLKRFKLEAVVREVKRLQELPLFPAKKRSESESRVGVRKAG